MSFKSEWKSVSFLDIQDLKFFYIISIFRFFVRLTFATMLTDQAIFWAKFRLKKIVAQTVSIWKIPYVIKCSRKNALMTSYVEYQLKTDGLLTKMIIFVMLTIMRLVYNKKAVVLLTTNAFRKENVLLYRIRVKICSQDTRNCRLELTWWDFHANFWPD